LRSAASSNSPELPPPERPKLWILVAAVILVAVVLVVYGVVARSSDPDRIINLMRIRASNKDNDGVVRLTEKLLELGPKGTVVASNRLRTSFGRETGCLLLYFSELGRAAEPYLEAELRRCENDLERLTVLRGIEAATGDPKVIPMYHKLLFSTHFWASTAARVRLQNIRGASGPYFDQLRTLSEPDEEQLGAMFEAWWSANQRHVRWTGLRFQIDPPGSGEDCRTCEEGTDAEPCPQQ